MRPRNAPRTDPLTQSWGLFLLTRPLNGLLSALGVLVGVLAAGVSPFESQSIAIKAGLVALAAFLGTAGGNVLNDLRDLHIDRTAHPERPLPSGRVRIPAARRAVLFFWALAILAAYLADREAGFLASGAVVALTWYELKWKKEGLPGNIAVALVSGSLFPLGALAVSGDLRVPLVLGLLAALAHLGRELFKDAEDAKHDRAIRRTYAVRHGTKSATLLGAVFVLLAVALSPLPHFVADWGTPFLLAIVPADLLFVFAAVAAQKKPTYGRAGAKGAMVLALLAFLYGAGWRIWSAAPM